MHVSENVSALEKKLKQAIDSRMVIEDARKYQVDTLSHFSAKLSLSCKGQDIELDNRLAKYRHALNKGTSFENLAPLINDILALLKNQESIQLAQQRDLLATINITGKQLQQTKELPEDTRRSLRNLLDQELKDIKSIHGYIPILNKLVAIYHHTLHAKQIPADSSQNADEVTQKLMATLNEISLDDKSNELLFSIKQRIGTNNKIECLLDAAIDAITLIVENINLERESAQSFLTSLNKTLEEIHLSIVSTSDHTESMAKEFDVINKRISSKIKNLNAETKSANSITSLKQLVENELKSLSKDIIEKEQLERKDRKILVDNFNKINKRIEKSEQNVHNYKERLNEQRLKSLLDSLTKLPNRAAFDEYYAHEMKVFTEKHHDITLVVIDVDHFKSINDQFGHSAGDITLQVIAKALEKSIRKSDFIARYGGEEFVLLMPNMTLDNALTHLDRLRLSVRKIPFKFKNEQIQITVSLGATQFKQGDTPLIAFDRADEALYEAKNSGRDRLCINK